jgi:translation elongation factor EF-G
MNFTNALPAELLDDTRLVVTTEEESYDDLENNVSDEEVLVQLRQSVFKRVFRQLLLLAIRLLNGEPTVNSINQDKFLTSAKASKDNTFCKRIHTLLAREMDAFPLL